LANPASSAVSSGKLRRWRRPALLAAVAMVGILTAPSFPVVAALLLAGLLLHTLWRPRWGTFFLILASPLLLLGAPFAGWMIYQTFVPAYSASFLNKNVTLKLEFFRANDLFGDGLDSKVRYLTLTGPNGRVKYGMQGWDWSHRARTSIYATDNGNFVVLGPDYEDVLIDVGQLTTSRAFRIASQDWTYLGAFDFVRGQNGDHDRTFRFISATEQAECVPSWPLSDGEARLPRGAARKQRCPAT
jgi:hypothetical protein